MAIPMTHLMKQINAELKAMNPAFKSFKQTEFNTKENAKELLKLYEEGLSTHPRARILRLKIAKPQDALPENEHIPSIYLDDAIKSIFGIHNQPLIKSIRDPEYVSANNYNSECDCTSKCKNCGAYCNQHPIILKVEKWLHYSQVIDKIVKWINLHQNWDGTEKDKYIQILQTIKSIDLLEKDSDTSHLLNFLRQYKINQATTAEAKYLITLELPNISSFETAKKVVIYSSINKH